MSASVWSTQERWYEVRCFREAQHMCAHATGNANQPDRDKRRQTMTVHTRAMHCC